MKIIQVKMSEDGKMSKVEESKTVLLVDDSITLDHFNELLFTIRESNRNKCVNYLHSGSGKFIGTLIHTEKDSWKDHWMKEIVSITKESIQASK